MLSDDEVGILVILIPYLRDNDPVWDVMDAEDREALESLLEKVDGSAAHHRWSLAHIKVDPERWGWQRVGP